MKNVSFTIEQTIDEAIGSRLTRLKKQQAAIELLKKYEALEAEIIVSDECWEPHGMATTPRLTQEQWDKVIELQGERNEILEYFRGKTNA